MKVIETRKDNRTGETVEVSWGNIKSDFSLVQSTMSIIEGLREQEKAKGTPDHNPILDRFTTIEIRIEL